jgi:hypothetical protein
MFFHEVTEEKPVITGFAPEPYALKVMGLPDPPEFTIFIEP